MPCHLIGLRGGAASSCLLGALLLGASVVEAARLPEEETSWFPCDQFRRGVVKCEGDNVPLFLGRGHFGEAWLAEEAESEEQVVIKLFLGGSEYLTGKDAPYFDEMKDKIGSNVRNECVPAMLVHEPDPDGHVHEGAQRIRRCLGSNFDDASESELLYVKLMETGPGSLILRAYHRKLLLRGTWTIDVARKITKQIFQGLEALARLPWVHHDLHPGNIVVREEGGEPLVQIIDFGSSISAAEGNECEFTPADLADFSPPESVWGPKVCLGFPAAFDARAPASHDAFSAGLTMIGILFSAHHDDVFAAISGAGLIEGLRERVSAAEVLPLAFRIWADSLDDPSKREALERWDEEMVVSFARELDRHYAAEIEWLDLPRWKRDAIVDAYRARLAELRGPAAGRFLKAAMRLVSYDPMDRPSVSALLGTAWMRETFVADNTREREREAAQAGTAPPADLSRAARPRRH